MDEQLNLIPYPRKVSLLGGSLHLADEIDVVAVAPARAAADYLGKLLERGAGLRPRYVFPESPGLDIGRAVPGETGDIARISFAPFSAGTEPELQGGGEAYRLTVDSGEISVEASGPEGYFWATQTIRQLLPSSIEIGGAKSDGCSLPRLEILDWPEFSWRGLHLDVSRHFFPVAFIKGLIDVLCLYKINLFHWHLTDDQGWRIEIKRYPELVETGSWRRGSDGVRQGGYYSQDEIRDVVAYASQRQVTIIPEIEMPGHARAAIAAFPWLSCTKDPIEVWNHGGISKDLFCAGREETFEFIQNVLDEIVDLFPSDTIHIGGDECPKERWKSCPECQARIRQEDLGDEAGLQGYFVRRVQAYLARLGRKIVGWDEIVEGDLAPGATVMSWRGLEGGISAAAAGHRAVMSPTSHCYFDYRQSANPGELGPTHFHPPVTTLRKVYSFDPIPDGLDEGLKGYIVGSQGNVWTEDIDTPERAGYMIFPRLCALAEVLWSPAQARNWEAFKVRLASSIRRLDVLSVTYCMVVESLDEEGK
ncbi:MAG TPA: beta-N-acetylhexosaminidase [Spirochaetia bacterium]|nr:beta-N-acetylhexosaminidase [Spirochaetia bacterium]